MTAAPLAAPLVVLYLLAGLGCAVAAWVRLEARAARLVDALLLLLFWPLYGPFLLVAPPAGAGSEAALLAAVRRLAGTPLARLVPDRAAIRGLGRALRSAAARVREIDAVLARPEMDAAALAQALAALPEGAPPEARASVTARLQSLGQLAAARERLSRRLTEIEALMAQALAQIEVLRLGGPVDGPGEELMSELFVRVQALGDMLADGPHA